MASDPEGDSDDGAAPVREDGVAEDEPPSRVDETADETTEDGADDADADGADEDANDEPADEAGDFVASADAPARTEPRGSGAWLIALGVTGLVAFAFTIGLRGARTGTVEAFGLLGAVYLGLAVAAVLRLRARGETHLLRPRSGDVTVGAFVAALLYGLALAAHLAVTSKPPHVGWVFHIYLLLGDPLSNMHLLVSAGLGVVGALEELTWRGLVLPVLEERVGTARASVTSSILYASAHLPTMFLLADPVAGRNPLLVVAALGCGLVWAYLRFRTGRLPPVLLAHALFTWAIVEFPLWRP